MVMVRWLVFAVFLVPLSGRAALFSATVDRTQITLDEHITLTLSLINSDTRLRAEGVSPNIDLTVLTPYFDLGTPLATNRFNAFRNRARSTSDVIVDLFPKEAGTYVIPSFTIDGESSQPITIQVSPSPLADAPLAFSRAGLNKETVWTNEQTLAFLDVYYRVDLDAAKLGGELEVEPTPLDTLEHYRLSNLERTEHQNGFEYKVMRSRWALFPGEAQQLRLYFPDVWITTRDNQNLRLPNIEKTLDVKPLTPGNPAALPAGTVTLDVLDETRDPETSLTSWRIRLTTTSSRRLLPDTLVTDQPQLRLYQRLLDATTMETEQGLTLSADYLVSLLASAATGPVTIPINVTYFNTETGHSAASSVTLSARPHVAPAPLPSTSPKNTIEAAALHHAGDAPTHSAWPLIALLFASLWLTTLTLLVKRTHRRHRERTTPASPQTASPPVTDKPLEQILLQRLGGRSLEEGLKRFQTHHGHHESVTSLVRDVQRYYYGERDKRPEEDELRERVKLVCDEIATLNEKRSSEQGSTKWLAEDFLRSPR